jgi:hypothetical protein
MAAATGLLADSPLPPIADPTRALDPSVADAAGALRADNIEQYKGEWREFLDRLGAVLPASGKVSRGSRGFSSQFDSTE